MRIYQGRNDP